MKNIDRMNCSELISDLSKAFVGISGVMSREMELVEALREACPDARPDYVRQEMARVAALEETLRHVRLAQEHIWGASCE